MKSLSSIPLRELSNEYLNLINKPDSLSILGTLNEAASIEEFLAIKKSLANVTISAAEHQEKAVIELANEFAKDFSLKSKCDWFMGQALAKFIDVRNPVKAIEQDSLLLGIWILFKYARRGYLVSTQIDAKYSNYSSLVPLIMSVYKKYHNKAYSEWTLEEVKFLTSPDLYAAMTFEAPKLSTEEILKDRQVALKSSPAESKYSLYFSKESKLYGCPALAQIMMCQTWCAHPIHRTKYMVLDSRDWDSMPKSLIDC